MCHFTAWSHVHQNHKRWYSKSLHKEYKLITLLFSLLWTTCPLWCRKKVKTRFFILPGVYYYKPYGINVVQTVNTSYFCECRPCCKKMTLICMYCWVLFVEIRNWKSIIISELNFKKPKNVLFYVVEILVWFCHRHPKLSS